MFKHIFIMLLCIVLVGCGGNRVQKQTVNKTETKVVIPNSDQVRECGATDPISLDQYLSKTMDEKEDYLSELIANLYNDIRKCNIQFKNLRDWFEEQKEIYNKKE